MITLDEWLGPYAEHEDATAEVREKALKMLSTVNDLLQVYQEDGFTVPVNQATGSQVSGQKNGGFRPKNSTVGAPFSKHKTGHAVDIYDPFGKLNDWITDELLTEFELYREHPDATPTWCHLQDISPGSKIRTFRP